MVLIRVPSALFFAKGADTIMSWQRGAADFISFIVKVISMIAPHEAIVAKPPPVPITFGGAVVVCYSGNKRDDYDHCKCPGGRPHLHSNENKSRSKHPDEQLESLGFGLWPDLEYL